MLFPCTATFSLPAACAGAVLFALAGNACAADSTPDWAFSGFGTLGVVHNDDRQADYVVSSLKGDGAGRTRRWSRHVDSKLGAQLDLTLDARWSAVLQVVTEQRLDSSYRPRVEWANVKYQATPELALRVGRIAMPMFIAGDYRKVGYAYPWVRPPIEVYGVLPIGSSDGVDLNWRWSGEAARSTTQIMVGRTALPLYDGARLRGHAIAGLSHTVERGDFSARASLITARLSLSLFPELFGALDNFGAQGSSLGRRLQVVDRRASAFSVGVNYDPGQWFATSKIGSSKVGGYLGSTRSAFVGGGWRHASLTPYAGYARAWGSRPQGPHALSLDAYPLPQAALGAQLNIGIAALLRTVPSQSTISAGLRWDAAPNIAFKLQHDAVTTRAGSRGMFINSAPDYQSGRTAQVSSAVLDFVF